MTTPQPSPSSPNVPDSNPDVEKMKEELAKLHDTLRKFEVDPDALALAFVAGNEMVFGEVLDHETFYEDKDAGKRGSFFEKAEYAAIKNPKRYTRVTMVDRNTGAQHIDMQCSDFDFIDQGIVEVRPIAFFFFDWLNLPSQISYCRSYVGFLEGRERARKAHAAAQSGLVQAPASALDEIRRRLGDRR